MEIAWSASRHGYDVSAASSEGARKAASGSKYEARKKEPEFEPPLRSNLVYHSDQRWGAPTSIVGIGDRAVRFTAIGAIANSEDSVEEPRVRVALRDEKASTRRLGASFERSTFEQDWRTPTLDALVSAPDISRPHADAIDDHAP